MPLAPIELSELSFAYGKPILSGVLKQSPECFFVEEILGFEPSGSGEHVFLWIEKQGLNTQQVASTLAKLARVPERLVSYAGMKDRHALTRQWFSVHLPGNQEVEWDILNSAHISVLTVTRHLRKLRRGVHKGNRFVITLTELEGDTACLQQRIDEVIQQGVPNYFGEQRFGIQGANLLRAQQWFNGEFKPKRHQRGIYLSAARSYLFNQLLSKRVSHGSWNQLLTGELLMLNGTHSVFAQQDSDNLDERLQQGDIHLTGPLYGAKNKLSCSLDVAELESEVLAQFPSLLTGLEQAKLKAERRALRLIPAEMKWDLNNQQLQLSFSLSSGCFATTVVRELVSYRTAGVG